MVVFEEKAVLNQTVDFRRLINQLEESFLRVVLSVIS